MLVNVELFLQWCSDYNDMERKMASYLSKTELCINNTSDYSDGDYW